MRRFDDTVERLFIRGLDHLHEVEEVQNELCVAVTILEDRVPPVCERLEYEPFIEGCGKRLDFRVDLEAGASAWIEVKTIHPRPLDRWDQYERALRQGYFPTQARLILEEDWLGGEVYHRYFSARARMIEYSIETEEKIECLPPDRGPVVLVLFSNGFDWHRDHLEDFLHFYRHGQPFEGDPLGLMLEHYVKTESLELRGTVDHFAFFKRGSSSVRPAGGCWSVKPVHFSPERGFL